MTETKNVTKQNKNKSENPGSRPKKQHRRKNAMEKINTVEIQTKGNAMENEKKGKNVTELTE
jgi:hypothetical protein